jgi:hypothetical protein
MNWCYLPRVTGIADADCLPFKLTTATHHGIADGYELIGS